MMLLPISQASSAPRHSDRAEAASPSRQLALEMSRIEASAPFRSNSLISRICFSRDCSVSPTAFLSAERRTKLSFVEMRRFSASFVCSSGSAAAARKRCTRLLFAVEPCRFSIAACSAPSSVWAAAASAGLREARKRLAAADATCTASSKRMAVVTVSGAAFSRRSAAGMAEPMVRSAVISLLNCDVAIRRPAMVWIVSAEAAWYFDSASSALETADTPLFQSALVSSRTRAPSANSDKAFRVAAKSASFSLTA